MPHRLFAELLCIARLLCCLSFVPVTAASCAHRKAMLHADTAAPKAGAQPAADHGARGLTQGRVVAVGPTGLNLPVLLRPLGPQERSFCVAAARALRLVYEEDVDDASQLEALEHRLHGLNALMDDDVAEAFGPILQEGIARARRLQACAPGIRALKDAYRAVYIEDGTHALRRLDASACQVAVQLLQPLAGAEPTWVLTVEPMGPKPLAELLAPCRS